MLNSGTTFVAAVVENEATNILKKISVKTRDPNETCTEVLQFFNEYLVEHEMNSFDALGVASFGPIDLNKESSTFVFLDNVRKWKC